MSRGRRRAAIARVAESTRVAWADLLRRIFAIDVLACACGGRLRFVAAIEPPVVQRILRHLGLPTDAPVPEDARGPGADTELAFDSVGVGPRCVRGAS